MLHFLVLFVSRAACAFLNVISDKSDCGPDACIYLLCVSCRICPAGYKFTSGFTQLLYFKWSESSLVTNTTNMFTSGLLATRNDKQI